MQGISRSNVAFGNTYTYLSSGEAREKQEKLQESGIESAIESTPYPGVLTIMVHKVHTDENGTKDLTNYKKSLDRNA